MDQPRINLSCQARESRLKYRRWHMQSWYIHKQSNAVVTAVNQWVSILDVSQTEAIRCTCSSSVCWNLTNVPAWCLTQHWGYLYTTSLTKLMVESIVDQNVRANAVYHPWFYCSQCRWITQCQKTICFNKGVPDNSYLHTKPCRCHWNDSSLNSAFKFDQVHITYLKLTFITQQPGTTAAIVRVNLCKCYGKNNIHDTLRIQMHACMPA